MKTILILLSLLSSFIFDNQTKTPSKYHLVTANTAFFAKAVIPDLNNIKSYNDFINSNETYKIISCDYLYVVRGGDVTPRHINNMNEAILPEDLSKIQSANDNTMIIIDNILAQRNDGVVMLVGAVAYKVVE